MKKYSWMLLMVVACQSSDPYWTSCENLAWLTKREQQMARSSTKGEILAYKYKGQVVFFVDDCLSQCNDGMAIVYDCSGKPICYFGGIAGVNTCPDFAETATEMAIVLRN